MYQQINHYNTEIEQAVLGICLLESEGFGRVYGMVTKEQFYHNGHQLIFETMADMYAASQPIDLLTITDTLVRKKNIPLIEGNNVPYFVTRLTHAVTGSTHLEYWCHILQSLFIEREIVRITNSGANNLSGDTRQKLFELQDTLSQLTQKQHQDDFKDMAQLMIDLYAHQDEMKKRGGVGLTTGIKKLDRDNGGYHPGQMILIAARPSVGKSAFAGMVAHAMAKAGAYVGFITLEMNNNEIAARLAAIDTHTDFNVIYRGLYQDSRQSQLMYDKIAKHTSTLPIFVSDKTGADIISIKARLHKLNSQVKRLQLSEKKPATGLSAVFIDYLQLVEGDNAKNRNREQEVSTISRNCKIVAKEMNIPLIAMAQLSRAVTQRKGASRYPELSDLRESGSLEQDADIVMFLHKDWLCGITQNEDGGSTEFETDLVVRKWRNEKANFIIPLRWIGGQMRFEEIGESYSIKTSEIESDEIESMPF